MAYKKIYGMLILIAILLSACAGFPSLNNNADFSDIPLGPQITLTEHQVTVFENILTHMEESYIHYDSVKTNWDNVRQKYITEINQGLSADEFNELMTQFENEFGIDEVIYINRQERITAETTVQTTQFVGIGAFVSYQSQGKPHVAILDVMPNSPAEKAGLRAHDSIYAVDGKPVTEAEGSNVVQRVRGEAGTTVVLSVQTPGESLRDVEIVRAPVNGIGKIKSKQLENDVAYILLPSSFSPDTVNEFVVVLSDYFEKNATTGLILDLRISNNGNNFPIDEMVTLFLNGDMGEVYSRSESQKISVEGQSYFDSQTFPLVVLVGEHTSGSAEVFAAFVQTSGRGVVIGSDTTGNVEVSLGFQLPDGGQIFIASSSIRLIGNQNIGLNGFSPQIQNEARWDEINPEQDPVILQALQSFEVTE